MKNYTSFFSKPWST